MPVFVEDPSQFSKSRLKSDLVAHNVPLPAEESKKQVYVELYLKHIDHKSAADFSSDEEDHLLATDDVTEEAKHPGDSEMLDPSGLTDAELRAALLKRGVNIGPIIATTRALYERRLIKVLQADQPSLNGTADATLYSDSEEEEVEDVQNGEEAENGEEPNSQEEEEEDSIAEQEVQEPDSSLNQLQSENPLPEEPMTVDEPVTELPADPTATDSCSISPAIVVTRRKPIKGAAGRPVVFKYPVTPPLTPVSPTTAERRELERRLVPIWVRILVFAVVVCLFILIFTYMNDGDSSPFMSLLDSLSSLSQGSEEEQLLSSSSEDMPVTDPIYVQE